MCLFVFQVKRWVRISVNKLFRRVFLHAFVITYSKVMKSSAGIKMENAFFYVDVHLVSFCLFVCLCTVPSAMQRTVGDQEDAFSKVMWGKTENALCVCIFESHCSPCGIVIPIQETCFYWLHEDVFTMLTWRSICVFSYKLFVCVTDNIWELFNVYMKECATVSCVLCVGVCGPKWLFVEPVAAVFR